MKMHKTNIVMSDFDKFSELFDLAAEDFERERKRLIEEEINKRPSEVQQRLRQFQWQLDMKRRRCKNPLEACFMFHEMLMDQVYGENGLLANLEKLLSLAKGKIDSELTDRRKTDLVNTKVFRLSR